MTDNKATTVRKNLLEVMHYTPYCGGLCLEMPRTKFNGSQFVCPACRWESSFPKEFISVYKETWNIR